MMLLFLLCVQEVNVVRQLATVTDALEKLQKQWHMHTREYKRHVSVEEGRIHDVEQRQEDLLEGFGVLEDDIDRVKQETNASLAKLVERIAEQFDEMQASLEAVKRQHAADHEHVMCAVEEVKEAQSDVRRKMEQMQASLNGIVERDVPRLDQEILRVQKSVDESTASTSERIEQVLVPEMEGVKTRVTAHETRMELSNREMGDAMREMRDGLQLQLNALEDHVADTTEHMLSKFKEYQSYVGRLRHELNSLNGDFQGAQEQIIKKVTEELDGAEETMHALTDHFQKKT